MYIKLDENMDLVITVNEPIYRGNNLNQKIIYLIPLVVGRIDLQNAKVYLNYVRDEGIPDTIELERMSEKYKEAYYQYTLPVDRKLTHQAGNLYTWLQICTGDPSNPTVSKSGECVLLVEDGKDMDDYVCDSQITAIYQLQKTVENEVAEIDEDIEKMNEDIAKKADDIVYDEDGKYLQLTANGAPIGNQVDMDVEDNSDVIYF